MYAKYCQGFEISSIVLKGLLDKNKEFRKFHDDVMSNDNVGEGLDSFLIRPIQRIPRYNLLIRELLKNTPNDHPDYQQLEKAQDDMEKLGELINTSVHTKANMERMSELEKIIKGYKVTVIIIYYYLYF
jgi:hypothetical protein